MLEKNDVEIHHIMATLINKLRNQGAHMTGQDSKYLIFIFFIFLAQGLHGKQLVYEQTMHRNPT